MATQLFNSAAQGFNNFAGVTAGLLNARRRQATEMMGMYGRYRDQALQAKAAGKPEVMHDYNNLANNFQNIGWFNYLPNGRRFFGNSGGGNYISPGLDKHNPAMTPQQAQQQAVPPPMSGSPARPSHSMYLNRQAAAGRPLLPGHKSP